MEKIKAGSVVKLKSGGSKMTVDSIATENAVCMWFDYNPTADGKEIVYHGDLLKDTFKVDCLELVAK